MDSILLFSLSVTAFGFAGWTLSQRKHLSKKDFNKNLILEIAIGALALFFAIR
ncbi:MAG: hypothetical protein PF542_02535 [Nanoarchaeota archaeon]|jgi:hypothetical protein|nr:hypothetical protein [Nanoarchaeota archaeon]